MPLGLEPVYGLVREVDGNEPGGLVNGFGLLEPDPDGNMYWD